MVGCFKSNKVILQRTRIPDSPKGSTLPNMFDITNYEKAIKTTIRKLKILKSTHYRNENLGQDLKNGDQIL